MARAAASLFVCWAFGVFACSVPRAHAANPTFERCAEQVAARPEDYESYRCYYEVASSSGDWESAARLLETVSAARPEIDWIVFARALVTWPVDKAAAEVLYREAARRFEAAGNLRGEVLARANLHTLLYESGRVASAAREIERITDIASRTQEAEIRIRARIVEAQFFITAGSNLGRAQRALQQAQSDLEATPTYWLRHHVLHGLGNVSLLTGQYDEAIAYFRELEQAAVAQQDLSTVATANLSIANALVEKRNEAPPSVDVGELQSTANRALDSARQSNDIDLELNALRLLGEVLMPEGGDRAQRYVADCVEKAQEQQRSQMLSQCLWIQARLLAASDTHGARAAIDAAIALLQYEEGTDQAMLAYAWRHAMRIAWQIERPAEAIESGTQALAAIERLRDLQPGLDSRAAVFSTWTRDYYWLSGQILRAAHDPELHADHQHGFIDAAFQIGERMRARALLDRLKAPAAPIASEDETALRRRTALLESIVQVNRELLQSRGRPSREQLRKLASLERREAEVRELNEASHVNLQPVSLADAQRALGADEALLVFQIGVREGAADRFAGGAWVYVVTRQEVRVFELPDRHDLTQSLALYEGLVRQSASLRNRVGVALFDRVLRQALHSLPTGIRRLIVVPDAPLDTFPLSALSATPEGEPLAKRFEIVLQPSVAIWYDWRSAAKPFDSRAVLVLADPAASYGGGLLPSMQRSAIALDRLPRARDEGGRILGHLRGRGTLWVGDDASEAALKSSDLSSYAVLHFAAHSVIDSSNPDRSAVLLAAGADDEDGLLQSREIPDLPIEGSAVVLSSCQSATGARVRGEGVLSLARSFFASGARAVVGSLWPIRDDHAQAFFDSFYAALAHGHTLSSAFHFAQRELIDRGYPMEAWAGFVLIGDGSTALMVRDDSSSAQWVVWGALIMGVAFSVGLAVVRRRC